MSRKSMASVTIIVLLAAVSVSWVIGSRRNTPLEPVAIRIARLPSPHAGLIHIADKRGFFAARGVTAHIETALTGAEAIDKVLASQADVASSAETPVARVIAEGKRLHVLATMFASQWNSGIVARRDHGILDPHGLRGKRIGYVSGTATHYMLEAFLAFHRIGIGEVTLVALRPDAAAAELVSGAVDAVSIWTPYLTRAQADLGPRALTFLPKDFYSERTNLVVRADYSNRAPQAVERLLRALLDAEAFARARPDEAIAIVAAASNMDPNALHGPGDPLTFELTLPQALLLSVENEIDWMIKRGFVPAGAAPDVLDAFEPGPLRKLKPDGVTLVK